MCFLVKISEHACANHRNPFSWIETLWLILQINVLGAKQFCKELVLKFIHSKEWDLFRKMKFLISELHYIRTSFCIQIIYLHNNVVWIGVLIFFTKSIIKYIQSALITRGELLFQRSQSLSDDMTYTLTLHISNPSKL